MNSFIERLESRKLLSTSVINLYGANTQKSVDEIHVESDGIHYSVNGTYQPTIKYPSSHPTILYHSGTCSGNHTLALYEDANVGATINMYMASHSQNNVRLNVYAQSLVTAILGDSSNNTSSSYVTSKYAHVTLKGGMKSTNNETSLNGNTLLWGGISSYNVMTGTAGGDEFRGGATSTNISNVGTGYNVFEGGTHSENDFYFNSTQGTGKLTTGSYSSNNVLTHTGAKPSGYVITGTITLKKF